MAGHSSDPVQGAKGGFISYHMKKISEKSEAHLVSARIPTLPLDINLIVENPIVENRTLVNDNKVLGNDIHSGYLNISSSATNVSSMTFVR